MSNVHWISKPYKENSDLVEQIRMVSLFCISLSSFASYLYYHYSLFVNGPNEWGAIPFDVLYKGVAVHTVLDLYYCNTYVMKIHHLFILSILFYNEWYQAPIEHRFLFTYPMLKTEISSIFFVLNEWLPKHTNIHHVNSLLFYVSFLKLRVYDYYVDLIQENIVLGEIIRVYSTKLSFVLYFSVYGLYSLNLYWIFVMNKLVYKTFFSSINRDIVCHSMCRVVYLLNIPLVLSLYPVYPIECIATIIHSFSAYLYHLNVYHDLALKKIDEYVAPTKENILFYIFYILSIHLRSFFSLLTHYPYSLVAILSGIFHLTSLYKSICRVAELFDDECKVSFLADQRHLLALPLLVDGFCIAVHKPIVAIPLYLVYLSMVILHAVNPFYKLTPIAFGIGFLFQTYYLSFIQTY